MFAESVFICLSDTDAVCVCISFVPAIVAVTISCLNIFCVVNISQVPIPSWFDDPNDRELLNLLPILEAIAESDDIFSLLQSQGFTSQAKQTTANIQTQLQQQLQRQVPVILQQNQDDQEER